jgi:hypothetical protein
LLHLYTVLWFLLQCRKWTVLFYSGYKKKLPASLSQIRPQLPSHFPTWSINKKKRLSCNTKFGYYCCSINRSMSKQVYLNVGKLTLVYLCSYYWLKFGVLNTMASVVKPCSLFWLQFICSRIYWKAVIKAWHLFHMIILLSLILKPCARSSVDILRKSVWVTGALRVTTAVHRWTFFSGCIPQKVMNKCDSGEACAILTCMWPVKDKAHFCTRLRKMLFSIHWQNWFIYMLLPTTKNLCPVLSLYYIVSWGWVMLPNWRADSFFFLFPPTLVTSFIFGQKLYQKLQ